jgi:hypothetical protein
MAIGRALTTDQAWVDVDLEDLDMNIDDTDLELDGIDAESPQTEEVLPEEEEEELVFDEADGYRSMTARQLVEIERENRWLRFETADFDEYDWTEDLDTDMWRFSH